MEPKERHVPRLAGVKSHKHAGGSRKVKSAAATPDNVYRRIRKVQRLSMELQAPLSLTTVLAFGTKSSQQHHHHHHRLLAKRKSVSADILPQQQPPPQPPPSVIQWEPLIHQSSSVPTVSVGTPSIPSGSRDAEFCRSSATSISASASAEAAEAPPTPPASEPASSSSSAAASAAQPTTEVPPTPQASEPASLTPYYRPTRTRSEDVTNDVGNGQHYTQQQRLHQTSSFPTVPALLRQYHHHREHSSRQQQQQQSRVSQAQYADEIISRSIVLRNLDKDKAQTPSPQASKAKKETTTIDLHNPTSSCPQLHISPSLQAVRFNCAKGVCHQKQQQPQPRLHQIQQPFPVQLQRQPPPPLHHSQPRSLTGEELLRQTVPQHHDHQHHHPSSSFQQDPPHTPAAHHKEPPQVPLASDDNAWPQKPHTSDPILMTSCQHSPPYSAAAPQQHVAVAMTMTTPGTFQGQQQHKWDDGGADIDLEKLQCRRCSHSVMENEARKLRVAMATGAQVLPTGFHVREDRCVTCGALLESQGDQQGGDMKPTTHTPTSSDDDDAFSPGTKLIVMAAIFNIVVVVFVIAAILHAQGVIDLTAWFRTTKG